MRKYKFVDIETIVKHKIVAKLNLEHAYIHLKSVQVMTDKVMYEYVENELSLNEIDNVIDQVLYVDNVNYYTKSMPIFIK